MLDDEPQLAPQPGPGLDDRHLADQHAAHLARGSRLEGDRPEPAGAERVGRDAADVDVHGFAGGQRGVQGGDRLRLDADHPGATGQRGRHPGHQPAAADGEDDGVDVRHLLRQLEPEGALTGADLRLVVGVAEQRPARRRAVSADS